MNRGNNFDLIRLLLASLVVGAHLYTFIGLPAPRWGEFILNPTFTSHVPVTVWVECFFVISGYLILASWERARGVIDYATKRIRRIYPAYAAAVIFGAMMAWWATTASAPVFWSHELVKYFSAQLTFMTQLQNTLPGAFSDHSMPMVNGALWTLKVEVCFYLCLPIIAWLGTTAGQPLIYGICYAGSAFFFFWLHPAANETWSPWALQLPGQLTFFVVGMVAWTYREQLHRWLLPLLIPMILLYLTADWAGIYSIRPLFLGWIVISLATALPFTTRAGRFGDLSYGIYIYHFPVIHIGIYLGWFAVSPWIGGVATVFCTLICAILSWHVIEKRFLDQHSYYRLAEKEKIVKTEPLLAHRYILGMRVDCTTYSQASQQITTWAKAGENGYVCAANVHMCMEAYDHADFKAIVNGARLVTPDGMPLVMMLRLLGARGQRRVYGPDLTLEVLAIAARDGIPVGLYGGAESTLTKLRSVYAERFPGLRLVYSYSPPFRQISDAEDEQIVNEIRATGVRILLVGLGCPKQERWVAAHGERLPCVQLAIGAAFAFHAGEVSQAPAWMQRLALEWLYRMAAEPRRLWRRYLYNNPRFVLLACWQLARRA